MRKEIKLLPCPFCGQNTAYIVNPDELSDLKTNAHFVRCDCGISAPERYGDNAKQEAIDVWNTRHDSVLERLPQEVLFELADWVKLHLNNSKYWELINIDNEKFKSCLFAKDLDEKVESIRRLIEKEIK